MPWHRPDAPATGTLADINADAKLQRYRVMHWIAPSENKIIIHPWVLSTYRATIAAATGTIPVDLSDEAGDGGGTHNAEPASP